MLLPVQEGLGLHPVVGPRRAVCSEAEVVECQVAVLRPMMEWFFFSDQIISPCGIMGIGMAGWWLGRWSK